MRIANCTDEDVGYETGGPQEGGNGLHQHNLRNLRKLLWWRRPRNGVLRKGTCAHSFRIFGNICEVNLNRVNGSVNKHIIKLDTSKDDCVVEQGSITKSYRRDKGKIRLIVLYGNGEDGFHVEMVSELKG